MTPKDVKTSKAAADSGTTRVLTVEDEFLVGIQLEEDLRAAGYLVVGPFSTLQTAMQASRCQRFDLAVLDINLKGEKVYPLADELLARRVPFIFLSGYISTDLPERFRASPRIAKPHEPALLIAEVQAAVWKAHREG